MQTAEKQVLIPSPFKVGRPLFNGKDRDQVISKLEYAFSIDATVKEACVYAGISTSSYYRFLDQEPKYRDRFTTLRTLINLKAKKTIVEAIFNENINVCMWWAERRMADEFSPNQVLKDTIAHLRKENEKLRNLLKDNQPKITSKDIFKLISGGYSQK